MRTGSLLRLWRYVNLFLTRLIFSLLINCLRTYMYTTEQTVPPQRSILAETHAHHVE